jgi:hypothetical protein
MSERPTGPQGWADPDPLCVEPEPIAPKPVRRRRYQGWADQPTPHWFAWLGLGICIGIVVVALVITFGRALDLTPGSGQTTSSAPRDLSGQPGAASAALSSAPAVAVPSPTPSEAPVPSPTGEVGTALIGGWATWYDVGPGFYAAAGPELRAALGDGWRHEVVEVVHGDRSVVVEIVDFCACGERAGLPTFLDLSIDAFSVLVDPAAGVIDVSIEIPGSATTLPPTDPSPHPDDERMRDEVRGDELYEGGADQ